jgi:hypothetical protein
MDATLFLAQRSGLSALPASLRQRVAGFLFAVHLSLAILQTQNFCRFGTGSEHIRILGSSALGHPIEALSIPLSGVVAVASPLVCHRQEELLVPPAFENLQ